MPSAVSSSSTKSCAWAQSPLASHQRAASGAGKDVRGAFSASDALNSSAFMYLPFFPQGLGTRARNTTRRGERSGGNILVILWKICTRCIDAAGSGNHGRRGTRGLVNASARAAREGGPQFGRLSQTSLRYLAVMTPNNPAKLLSGPAAKKS